MKIRTHLLGPVVQFLVFCITEYRRSSVVFAMLRHSEELTATGPLRFVSHNTVTLTFQDLVKITIHLDIWRERDNLFYAQHSVLNVQCSMFNAFNLDPLTCLAFLVCQP